MDRRDFLYSLGVSVAATSLATAHAETSDAIPITPGKHPNVILMICDDLGYGDLGCYGSKLPTPNLDRLAREGVRFTHYNSCHPICSASRAALLTGRYGGKTHTAPVYFPNSASGMSLEAVTLADLFRKKNFETMCIGKWHLGDAPKYMPLSRGFQHYFGVPYSDDMKPLPLYKDTTVLMPDADRPMLTPQYTHAAVEFLDGHGKEKPFFMYLAFSYPHDPAQASPRFKGKTRFGDVGDAITEIDWSVGEIMKTLKKNDLTKDTLVMFTSDHGPWFQGNPGLLRGRKGTTFEGGFRVPMIARWPERLPAGRICDQWTSSLDVLPTLAGFCGLDVPHEVDGIDMRETFVNNKPAPEGRKPLIYFSPSQGHTVHCIRDQDWKLRVAQCSKEAYVLDELGKENHFLSHPELYNVREDPAESYDVAKWHPEIVARLRKSLDAQMKEFPQGIQENYDTLKENLSGATPPGALPRPLHGKESAWHYVDPSRE